LNPIKALQTIGNLKRVSDILQPENGNQRWDLLQAWLAKHPKYKAKLESCLTLSPLAALVFLCEEFDLDLDGLSAFDPTGAIRQQVLLTIERFQELYRERAAADVPPRQLPFRRVK
jgi:hypothetical protein